MMIKKLPNTLIEQVRANSPIKLSRSQFEIAVGLMNFDSSATEGSRISIASSSQIESGDTIDGKIHTAMLQLPTASRVKAEKKRENAQFFQEDDSMITDIGQLLGMSATDINEFFAKAKDEIWDN